MYEVLEEDEAEFNRERSAVIGVGCTSSMAKSVKINRNYNGSILTRLGSWRDVDIYRYMYSTAWFSTNLTMGQKSDICNVNKHPFEEKIHFREPDYTFHYLILDIYIYSQSWSVHTVLQSTYLGRYVPYLARCTSGSYEATRFDNTLNGHLP
jgi:hypothetical protein